MNVKDESENLDLKLKIQKTKIMAFSPITAWQIDVETMETVTGFTFLCSKITEDGDFSHERKRRLLLGEKKAMTNQGSMLKSRDITLPTKVRPVKDTVFPAVMYGCESWTVREAAGRNIDAFGLWSWRRLLRVPWTAGKSKLPILKETNPEYSSEILILMLKLKLPYFDSLMQKADSLEKTLMLGKIKAKEEREGKRRDGEIASPTHWT